MASQTIKCPKGMFSDELEALNFLPSRGRGRPYRWLAWKKDTWLVKTNGCIQLHTGIQIIYCTPRNHDLNQHIHKIFESLVFLQLEPKYQIVAYFGPITVRWEGTALAWLNDLTVLANLGNTLGKALGYFPCQYHSRSIQKTACSKMMCIFMWNSNNYDELTHNHSLWLTKVPNLPGENNTLTAFQYIIL